MNGKKLTVAFMLLASTTLAPDMAIANQNQEATNLKAKIVAELVERGTIKNTGDAIRVGALLSKILDKIQDDGPRSTISKKDIPKYLDPIIDTLYGKDSYNHGNTTVGYICNESSRSNDFEHLMNDGKCLGFLYGKTPGNTPYKYADVYAIKDNKVVCLYNVTPPSETTVMLDAWAEGIGEMSKGAANLILEILGEKPKNKDRYDRDYSPN